MKFPGFKTIILLLLIIIGFVLVGIMGQYGFETFTQGVISGVLMGMLLTLLLTAKG